MISNLMINIENYSVRSIVFAARHMTRIITCAASYANKDHPKRSDTISDTDLHDFAHNIISTQVPIWSLNLKMLSRKAIDNHSLLERLGEEIAFLSDYEISILRAGRKHKYFGSR
jgi:hypothetical protein